MEEDFQEDTMDNFDKMAIKGSCDDASGGAKECEKTIVADTPQELKTQLQSKIQTDYC